MKIINMKILKIVFVVITAILIISIFQPRVHAATSIKSFDEMKSSINAWMNKGKSGKTGLNSDGIKAVIVPVINILTVIGIVVIVGVTMVMGMKYMFASPEQAAKLKQQLIGLVVSAVVILGATAIWKIVYKILESSKL